MMQKNLLLVLAFMCFIRYAIIVKLLPKCMTSQPKNLFDPTIGGRESKPILAICAATRSLQTWKTLSDTSLQTLLIPSIERTVTEQELKEWDVRLYLAIDHDDTFWHERHESLNTTWLSVAPRFYESPPNRVPFNEMMSQAYTDGAEYMVRVNDDTEFVTRGWITRGVRTLREFDPPNVGVVGPTCHEGNTGIMTHDMVHRTHLDIFDHYYPSVFSACWLDDWITRVYQPGRSVKLEEWVVVHHIGMYGSRYYPSFEEEHRLDAEVAEGEKQVEEWVSSATRAI